MSLKKHALMVHKVSRKLEGFFRISELNYLDMEIDQYIAIFNAVLLTRVGYKLRFIGIYSWRGGGVSLTFSVPETILLHRCFTG